MAVMANPKKVALEYAPHGVLKASFLNYPLSINKHQVSSSVHAGKISPPNLNKTFLVMFWSLLHCHSQLDVLA